MVWMYENDWICYLLFNEMNEWMDGWMNGWMDEWMDGWMDEWMDEWREFKIRGAWSNVDVLCLWIDSQDVWMDSQTCE